MEIFEKFNLRTIALKTETKTIEGRSARNSEKLEDSKQYKE